MGLKDIICKKKIWLKDSKRNNSQISNNSFNLARGEISLFPRAVIGWALTRSDSFSTQMNHPKFVSAPIFHNIFLYIYLKNIWSGSRAKVIFWRHRSWEKYNAAVLCRSYWKEIHQISKKFHKPRWNSSAYWSASP